MMLQGKKIDRGQIETQARSHAVTVKEEKTVKQHKDTFLYQRIKVN